MEIVQQTILIGVLVFICLKLGALVLRYLWFCHQLRQLPHPPMHWLRGNMDQIRDSVSYLDTLLGLVQKQGARLYVYWLGPLPNIGVTHPATFRQLINAVNEKAIGYQDGYRFLLPWIGDGLLISGGRKWERNRKLLTPAFHFSILLGYISRMNDAAGIFLDKIWKLGKDGSSFNVCPSISKVTLDVMLRCALSCDDDIQKDEGADHPYIEAVHALSRTVLQRMFNPLLHPDFVYYRTQGGRDFLKYCDLAHAFTGKIIAERKKKLKGSSSGTADKVRLDFLDILLTAQDEEGQGLSDQEIKDEVDTFTFEGHDTTASALSWAIYSLGDHPHVQDLVYQDVQLVLGDRTTVTSEDLGKFDYLNCFLKEVLRYHSPVPIIARKHSETVVLDGRKISAGPRIEIPIHSIHHNPEIWPDHMEFRPERFNEANRDSRDPYGFIPFSAGSRNCIGQNFAMNEMKILTAKLVQRFEVVLDRETQYIPDVVMKAKDGVWIRLKERST